MNSGLQKRLYEMEVMPPASVWEKLSLNIDEINADNILSKKIVSVESAPPIDAWEKINSSINVVEKKQPVIKGVVINFRRLAAAAIFIGIIVTAWFLYRNSNEKSSGPVTQTPSTERAKTDSAGPGQQPENIKEIDRPVSPPIASLTTQTLTAKNKKKSTGFRTAQLIKGQLGVLNNTPHGKSFDQPIDDLSLVTADQHYLTMVNSNGRLVKIPAQLAHLAPHLQEKPISEDIYEVMFGEGTYWKETMSEWRKKIASMPVSSGDAFTSFIELLKTVQDK
ncbi:MAG TPA: hypothetical protein VFT15_10045 [Chitinophagaceae bacterium]|nr:hypothetical protein [Chitinophagaceae bacterium]